MTTPHTDPEVELLKAAFDHYAPVPEHLAEMLMIGYHITTIESRLARLVEDSLVDGVATVRAGEPGVRFLSFEDDVMSIELEIDDRPMMVTGHIQTDVSGRLTLETPDGPSDVEVADDGGFSFTLHTQAPFRLRFDDGSGIPIVTEWMTP
jgi:hypothetical protein